MLFIKTNLVRYITFNLANAITLFPFVLIDKRTKITRRLVQHEKIHLKQQMELLIIPFYILYLLEYAVNLFRLDTAFKAYFNISFERECYQNERVTGYLKKRKMFSWINYYI